MRKTIMASAAAIVLATSIVITPAIANAEQCYAELTNLACTTPAPGYPGMFSGQAVITE